MSSEAAIAKAGRRSRPAWTVRGVLAETLRGFRADRGLDLAGSLAFTTLLTTVPLLATFSLVLVDFFQDNDEEILAILNAVIPYPPARFSATSRTSSWSRRRSPAIGLVLLVIASVRLVFVVEGVFNAVWGAPRRKARLARIFLYTFALAALGLVLGGIGAVLRAIRSADTDSILSSPAVAAAASLSPQGVLPDAALPLRAQCPRPPRAGRRGGRDAAPSGSSSCASPSASTSRPCCA